LQPGTWLAIRTYYSGYFAINATKYQHDLHFQPGTWYFLQNAYQE